MKSIDQINLRIREHMKGETAGLPSYDSQIRINALSWVRRNAEKLRAQKTTDASLVVKEIIEFRISELNSLRAELMKFEFYFAVNDSIMYADELKWVLADD